MALFSSGFRQHFERFARMFRKKEAPLKAQQCAAQEQAALEKLPEASVTKTGENKAFDFIAKIKKHRRRRRQCGEKKKEREVKERELNEEESLEDKAEKETKTLGPEKMKDQGRVPQKKSESAFKPASLLVEVKPLQILVSPAESSFRIPLEEDLVLPSVSEDLPSSAALFKPLPPVTKCPETPDPAPEEVSLPGSPPQVSPPKALEVPSCPAPASDPQSVVDLQCSSTQASPLSPVQSLQLINIEDEETEYVEYTGITYQACVFSQTERPRKMMAERKQRRLIAWMESDSEELELVWSSEGLEEAWPIEVLEEVWPNEGLEIQACEKKEDNPDEMGDSKAVEGHVDDASQKKEELNENMISLFCGSSPEGPRIETQHDVEVRKEPKSNRKLACFLITLAEWKAKKEEDKKRRKEKERREKESLLERCRNDPVLKHLVKNKH